jgi:hypothetical protein
MNTDNAFPIAQIERLKEAWRYFEEMRYSLILARMKELGGCRCWDWKPQHIEAMLVKLGLEEPVKDEKTNTRRRRQQKAAARRQGSPCQPAPPQQPLGPVSAADWNQATAAATGLGLHPGFAGHPHAHHLAVAAVRQNHYLHPHPHHPQQQQHFVTMSPAAAPQPAAEDFPAPPNLTPKQEEDLVNEIFKSRRLTPEEDEEEASSRAAGRAARG